MVTTSNLINNPLVFADYLAGGSTSTLWNVFQSAAGLNSYWITVQASDVRDLSYK